jgi:hypothetical protein
VAAAVVADIQMKLLMLGVQVLLLFHTLAHKYLQVEL